MDGLITIVSTWQLLSVVFVAQFSPFLPPVPSSNVTKTAVLPDAYPGLARIAGRLLLSHESPWAIVPSCMSSMRFGVTNEKAGSALSARSCSEHVEGICTNMYTEDVPRSLDRRAPIRLSGCAAGRQSLGMASTGGFLSSH